MVKNLHVEEVELVSFTTVSASLMQGRPIW